jgi:hypothetical protein
MNGESSQRSRYNRRRGRSLSPKRADPPFPAGLPVMKSKPLEAVSLRLFFVRI